MFVWKSTYDELQEKCNRLAADKDVLKERCDHYWSLYDDMFNNFMRASKDLVSALEERNSLRNRSQLSNEEIKKMLLLCHPDKHGGKQIAHEVTQKLLAMRGK